MASVSSWFHLPKMLLSSLQFNLLDFAIGEQSKMPNIDSTHNFVSIIALITIALTAMSLPLRYSITFSVCLRFHRNLQW